MYAIVQSFVERFLSLVSALGAGVEEARCQLVALWSSSAAVREQVAALALESFNRTQSLFEHVFTLLIPEGAPAHLASAPHHLAGILALSIVASGALLVARLAVLVFLAPPSSVSPRAVRRHQQELRRRAQVHAPPHDQVALGEDAPSLSPEQVDHIRSHGWKVVRPDRIEGVLRARDGRPTEAAFIWDRYQRRYSVSLGSSVLSSWMANSPFRACLSNGTLNYHLRELPAAAHRDPGSLIESLQVFAAREQHRSQQAS